MSKNWCLTFQTDEKEKDQKCLSIRDVMEAKEAGPNARKNTQPPSAVYSYLGWGLEQGAGEEEKAGRAAQQGNWHYQAYLQAIKQVRITTLMALFSEDGNKKTKWGVHFEPAKGSPQQNLDYITKECGEDKLNTWGTINLGGQGRRNDIHEVAAAIVGGAKLVDLLTIAPEAILKYPNGCRLLIETVQLATVPKYREVKVIVYWGNTGCGKTYSASWQEKHPDCHQAMSCDWNVRGIPKRWPDYHGEKRLILDDFQDSHMTLGILMALLDNARKNLAVMTSNKLSNWTEVYITANEDPQTWYSNCSQVRRDALARRIHKVVHFTKPWREQTPVIESDSEDEDGEQGEWGEETDEIMHGPVSRYADHARFLFDREAE